MDSLYRTDTKTTKSSIRSGGDRPEILGRVITAASSIRSLFSLRSVHASGPGAIFNPTNIRLRVHRNSSDGLDYPAPDMALLWRSRDHRKGRRSIAVPRSAVRGPSKRTRFTASIGQIRKGVFRMFTVFPYNDMAYWVGVSFTIGSAIFVANGLICLLPVAYPKLELHDEDHYASCLTSFFGVVCFQVGATLGYLEAVNDGSFHGSVMRRFLEGREDEEKQLVKLKLRDFIHQLIPHRARSTSLNGADEAWPSLRATPSLRRGALDLGSHSDATHDYSPFRWWPTWKNMKRHYIFEIGWLACTVQFIGATIYGVGGIVNMPGLLSHMSPSSKLFAYWISEMVASVGFITASLLFALETQDKWYKPQPRILGWWIGLFALIGSIGFELSAAFGPAAHSHHFAEIQVDLSSTWGSACFLIASALHWYEAVNKTSVEELHDEPADMKDLQVQPVHV